MSRRSVLIAWMRRNAKQKGAPNILIMPAWVSVNGEPLVTWALDARKPTKEEIAAAVAAWKREQAAAKSTDEVHEKPSTLKPAQGSGEEEID